MKKLLIFAAAISIAGCASRGEEAASRYEIVNRHGTPEEICVAAREVADGYLSDGNEERYAFWQAKTMLDCNAPALDRL